MKWIHIHLAMVMLLSLTVPARCDELAYQNRDNPSRTEGIAPQPIDSYFLSVVSFTIKASWLTTYDQQGQVTVGFFLPPCNDSVQKVKIHVSKLDLLPNYLMDELLSFPRPKGMMTLYRTFSWPTSEVLVPSQITVDELGARVTTRATPNSVYQYIQPVIFSPRPNIKMSSQTGAPVRYDVTVVSQAIGHVTLKVFRLLSSNVQSLPTDSLVFSSGRLPIDANIPLHIEWPTSDTPSGWYCAALQGTATSGQELHRNIVFFHQAFTH
jgi:hypothetical protein